MMDNTNRKSDLLTSDVTAEIDKWIAKYPDDQKQSAVMAALHIAQDANDGWLTTDMMDAIADYLGMPEIAVYEVASFYSMYELKPVGRHKICVCTNISCMLCDSENVVNHLENKLGIKLGETTKDGKFTLKEVECLGACVDAPVLQVGKDYHAKMTPEKIDDLLDSLD